MKQITISLFFIFFSSFGIAQVDVTCWNQNCLKSGWTWKDLSTNHSVDYGCYRDGCDISGWIIGSLPNKSYTQCKSGGCFVEGWYHVDSQSQALIKQIVCRTENSTDPGDGRPNCLRYGWTSYSSTGQNAVITCFQSNCSEKGWLVQTSGQLIRVTCKNGSCFQFGWRED